jgi:hypothetical protein
MVDKMHLSKLIHSKSGKTVISILLGIGLATFFRAICKDKNCMIMEAPPLDEMENQVYLHDGKCYKYQATSVRCDPKKATVGITKSTDPTTKKQGSGLFGMFSGST